MTEDGSKESKTKISARRKKAGLVSELVFSSEEKTHVLPGLSSICIVCLHPTEVEGEPSKDMTGDYAAVVVELNGSEVVRYGDHYHEKGFDKACGYIDGLLSVYRLLGVKTNSAKVKYLHRLDESVN